MEALDSERKHTG